MFFFSHKLQITILCDMVFNLSFSELIIHTPYIELFQIVFLFSILRDVAEEEGILAVQNAIRSGINYIDTAPYYGQGKSEKIIGKALKGIPREAYYIATKVGRYEIDIAEQFDFSPKKTRESFQKSLEYLGLDYVDIIQVREQILMGKK